MVTRRERVRQREEVDRREHPDPVEKLVTQFQQACKQFKQWWTEQGSQPVEQWVSQLQQTCVEQSYNWWCLCCNKWLCWLAWVVVKVVTRVVTTVVRRTASSWITSTARS